jgi:hypothetical protein
MALQHASLTLCSRGRAATYDPMLPPPRSTHPWSFRILFTVVRTPWLAVGLVHLEAVRAAKGQCASEIGDRVV